MSEQTAQDIRLRCAMLLRRTTQRLRAYALLLAVASVPLHALAQGIIFTRLGRDQRRYL